LSELGLEDLPVAGGKAARLGHLAKLGFDVPDGFVLLSGAWGDHAAARTALDEGLATLGDAPVAVRSSGTVEDLSGASFAGQYESVLGVIGRAAVIAAVDRCWDSAREARVRSYANERAGGQAGPMAVLIQRMVAAEAAGVAYSSNPLTGNSNEVVISAVRGLGERLVAGEAAPDEWIVRNGAANCASPVEGSIEPEMALEIARLASRVADAMGSPQDVEWAVAGGKLHLLQARPMVGTPEWVVWDSPIERGFARHFRFGEWIGDPVTPLFESWLLSRLEEGLHSTFTAMSGMAMPPPNHVVVNGWYFYALPVMPSGPRDAIRFLLPVIPKLLTRPRRVAMMIPATAHLGVDVAVREWRQTALPRHLLAVGTAESQVDSTAASQLMRLVDDLARETGAYFTYVTLVAGFAAKAEYPLGTFYREHLHPRIGGSHLELLQGLVHEVRIEAHAVASLDWYFRTSGELNGAVDTGPHRDRRLRLVTARCASEASARAALAGQPTLAGEFEKLLATAQRFQPIREECISHLTRPWPVMRRALSRIAEDLVERHVIADAELIHFLTYEELAAALGGSTAKPPVRERRTAWEGQRRLSPPLTIGPVAPMMRRMLEDFADATRSPSSGEGIRGVAASPGRASGPVRIIRDASEFDLLQPGDVLVTQATTPAWTPLFARAAAVVTDTGSIGSHSSQVAREYGIPAVVCTGDATARLTSGQVVTVDGGAGLVILAPESMTQL